jgi:hypothetical protein
MSDPVKTAKEALRGRRFDVSGEMLFRGVPLEEFEKGELIRIIGYLERMRGVLRESVEEP